MTTIQTAAHAATVKGAAIGYVTAGISVIPLTGKKPAIPAWQGYQQRRADVMEIGAWDKRQQLFNVGIVCGEVSGNLVVMDLDGPQAVAMFESAFPDRLATFTVKTGSGRGKHIYYHVNDLPPTTRLMNINGGNIELRANGCYVVAPPSIHPDTGWRYTVISEHPIMHLRDMTRLLDWMRDLYESRRPKSEQKSKPEPWGMGSRYAQAGLESEAYAVKMAPEGSRNDRLNVAAYNIGQLVGDNLLSRSEVESRLLGAATAIGLPESEARRTIESGLTKGIAEPRSLQWTRRQKPTI